MPKKKTVRRKASELTTPKKKVVRRKKTASPDSGELAVPAKGMVRPAGPSYSFMIQLERIYTNRPQRSAVFKQLNDIAQEAQVKVPGWSSKIVVKSTDESYKGDGVFQKVQGGIIRFEFQTTSYDTKEQIIIRAQRIIGLVIQAGTKKNREWTVVSAIGPNNDIFDLNECRDINRHYANKDTSYINLPENWEPFFKADIYGLDPQIRVMWDALTSFVRSSYLKRSHVCCHGQPGCGKTSVCEKFYDMLKDHSPPDAVMRFTASQTTKAGLENILLEANPIPSLIIIEEIDKSPPENLAPLIDICNSDGMIRKATARSGNLEVPIHALVICTVNDVPKFRSFHSGALASRFAHKVFFPRPSEDVLRQIAYREIRKFKGDVDWVEPAMAILKSEMSNDPRRLKAILDGGNRLIDGSFLQDIEYMRKAIEDESEELRKMEERRKKIHNSLNLSDL